MSIPQMLVKVVSGDGRAQLRVRLADGDHIPQMTVAEAGEGQQPRMSVRIVGEGERAQWTVAGLQVGIDYAARVLALEPIAYYQLNGDATDSSGNGYDGSATGVTFGAEGIGDGGIAASFDGSTSFVDISAMRSVFDGAHGAITAWAQASAVGDWSDATARTIARIASSTTNFVDLKKTATPNQVQGTRRGSTAGVVGVTDTSLAGTANWFHVALTWDTSVDELKVYINGAQVGATQSGNGTFSGTPLVTTTIVGGSVTSGGGFYWKGNIAHLALFDRALSDAEVLSLGVL